jgi:hypothetical protein
MVAFCRMVACLIVEIPHVSHRPSHHDTLYRLDGRIKGLHGLHFRIRVALGHLGGRAIEGHETSVLQAAQMEWLKILAFSLQDRPRVSLQAVPQQVIAKLRELVIRWVHARMVGLRSKHPLCIAETFTICARIAYAILTAWMRLPVIGIVPSDVRAFAEKTVPFVVFA